MLLRTRRATVRTAACMACARIWPASDSGVCLWCEDRGSIKQALPTENHWNSTSTAHAAVPSALAQSTVYFAQLVCCLLLQLLLLSMQICIVSSAAEVNSVLQHMALLTRPPHPLRKSMNEQLLRSTHSKKLDGLHLIYLLA
jgi:hypothetical protein